MNMSDATHTEIERLKLLHRSARVALAGLEQLPERSPEDDLRLRAQMRLAQGLADRIQWLEAQLGANPSLAAATLSLAGAEPDALRVYY
jgi:thioredoxin-like negative regulator of GroEL